MQLKRDMVDELEDEYPMGFDELFVEPLSDAHECPICLLALNNPMQTTCGHRFCKGCITKVVKGGRACCPIDNAPIGANDLHLDAFARREISQLDVHCRFYREHGCPWVGPLSTLPEHLKACQFSLEDCPKNCGEKLKKQDIEDHLKNHCLKRIVACEFCGLKLIAARLPDHLETCGKVIVPCPNGCDRNDIRRENLQQHYEKECTKTQRKCLFREHGCMFEGSVAAIEKHMNESSQEHIMILAKENRSLKRDLMELRNEFRNESQNKRVEMSSISKEELIQIRMQLNDIDMRTEKSRNLIDAYRGESTNRNLDLENRLDELRRHVNKNTNMITEVSSKICNGHFIWRIPNFEALFQDAKGGKTPALHSSPFYSSVPGYRMCLRLNLNGIASGTNTHVSMFLHFMQGEYDNIVTWPFSGSLKFKIMQQDYSNGQPKHVEETLTSRPTLQAFLRPRTVRNHKGYGYVEMISHDALYSQGYVKDDALIVSVEVTPGPVPT